jgi:pyruvate formate lyase activating enzyme
LGCTIGNIADDLKLTNEIINDACSNSENIGVAYTYNEPTVWFEFMHEITMAAKSKGLKNVMVSNGFINESPLVKLLEVIDAFNIDLKAFTDSFYVEMAGGKLDPVLKSLKMIKQSNKHLEITNLLIPRKNDNIEDFADMVNWIANELGEDTVLHISRYFPNYKQLLPTTNEDALIKMHEIARKKLNYVYLGNIRIADYANTSCPNCDKKLIIRNGYQVEFSKDFNNGVCGNCGTIVLKPNHIR